MTIHTPLNFHLSPMERLQLGKDLRKRFGVDALESFQVNRTPQETLDLQQAQNAGRLSEYLPIRYGRMLENPFALYRASAAIMAHDLAHLSNSGVTVQLCGDAHLGNFGLYASPERQLMFDLNDFDETLPGPFEWDLYRLAASCVVAAKHLGFHDSVAQSITRAALQSYQEHIQDFAGQKHLEVWYHHVDADRVLDVLDHARDHMQKSVKKANKAPQQALEKMAVLQEGQWKFKADPPKLQPVQEGELRVSLEHLFNDYLDSLPVDRHFLLGKYHFVDAAYRLTGVSSAGRQVYVALMQGQDARDTLILQLKQAFPSTLESALGKSVHAHHGERVVAGQKLMQATSDIFLGWTTFRNRHYYVRQLRDRKGSIEIEDLSDKDLKEYSELCAYVLARAHARSGDATLISGFMGEDDAFANAVTQFALKYAQVNQRDFDTLLEAEKWGKIQVQRGI